MAVPYKIAVAIAMSSNHNAILSALSSHVLRVDADVNKLTGSFGRLKVALLGGLGITAGFGVLAVMGKVVDKGNALVKIQRDMAQAGVTNVQVQDAYNKSWSLTSQYKNMSPVEIMKMQNDARMTFGDQDTATHHISPYVGMASFLKSYEGGKHGGVDSSLLAEVNAAMKSGEIAGKISPEAMEEHVKQLTAMKIAYGEQLKIATYLTAQRAGGVALRNTSDSFRYGMFPALVQENGSNAGVMLMTAFNKIVAGTGNRTKSLEHMAEIGLLKPDQLEYNKVGMIKGLKDPSAIMNNRDAAVNFGDWVMTTLKPKLDAQTNDPIRQSQLISSMFPDRNAAKAITEVLQQYTKLEKDATQMLRARNAMDVGAYNAGSYDYQMQAFHTQWDSLLTALGSTMVPKATEALAKINNVISGMAAWAGDKGNADTIKLVGDGLAAMGLALAGTGAAALIGALGPTGWLVGGIVALSGAAAGIDGNLFGGLTTKILDALKGSIDGLSFSGAFTGIGDKIFQALKTEISDEIANFGRDLRRLGVDPAGKGTSPGKTGKTGKPWKENILPQSFNPGQQTMTAQPIQISMNVDGRSLAQSVSEQLLYLATHNSSAPSANGRSYPMGGDHNATST